MTNNDDSHFQRFKREITSIVYEWRQNPVRTFVIGCLALIFILLYFPPSVAKQWLTNENSITEFKAKNEKLEKDLVEASRRAEKYEIEYNRLNEKVAPFIAMAVKQYPNEGIESAIKKLSEQLRPENQIMRNITCKTTIRLKKVNNGTGICAGNVNVYLAKNAEAILSGFVGQYNTASDRSNGDYLILIQMDLTPKEPLQGQPIASLGEINHLVVKFGENIFANAKLSTGSQCSIIFNGGNPVVNIPVSNAEINLNTLGCLFSPETFHFK